MTRRIVHSSAGCEAMPSLEKTAAKPGIQPKMLHVCHTERLFRGFVLNRLNSQQLPSVSPCRASLLVVNFRHKISSGVDFG
jgi:hypothetical protein